MLFLLSKFINGFPIYMNQTMKIWTPSRISESLQWNKKHPEKKSLSLQWIIKPLDGYLNPSVELWTPRKICESLQRNYTHWKDKWNPSDREIERRTFNNVTKIFNYVIIILISGYKANRRISRIWIIGINCLKFFIYLNKIFKSWVITIKYQF